MKVVPLGPGFAAELRGVTLAEIAADDAAYAAARAAFEEHSVLVLRGQDVTDEVQLAFSRRFGPPEVTKVGSLGTGSHFVILSTIGGETCSCFTSRSASSRRSPSKGVGLAGMRSRSSAQRCSPAIRKAPIADEPC